MINLFKNLRKENKTYFQLLVLYSLSHIWIIFLANSLFWDDWHLKITNPDQLDLYWEMVGAPIRGLMIKSLFNFGYYTYRLLSFFLLFINAIFLDKILTRIKIVNENNRFITCLIFLIAPLYIDRVTIICFPYTLCTFLFFAAWYLQPKQKLISLALYLVSFSTNSLLVFYALPTIEKFYLNYSFKKKSIIKFFKNNIIFIIVPFLYYLSKKIFFSPFGLFKGYNNWFALKNLFITPFVQILDALYFKSSFILFIPISVLIFSYIFFRYIPIKGSSSDSEYSKTIFILGIFSLLLGLFPYWLLNLIPSFNAAWMARHQLLMPLGISLITASVLSKFNLSSRRILLSLLVTISLIINLSNYFSLIQDHSKQIAIIKELSIYKMRDNIDVVIFEDNTKNSNAKNRAYRTYEWQGIINEAYPDKVDLIGLNSLEELSYLVGLFKTKCQKRYGYKKTNLPEIINVSRISISKKENSRSSLLSSKIYEILLPKYEIKEVQSEKINKNDYTEISSYNWDTKNFNGFICED
tara:strand:+ start:676 stop:2247 length:1572 start_codon:yes stop_codon:yes gene_type:complete